MERGHETEPAQLDDCVARHANKTLLRFMTCGSVDDGKSTLIGRLLFDTKALFADQLAALELDSKRFGTRGEELDYALLLDGLCAEREQGITIDVAYRFFATERRKYIVADTPGHEQYTRNMVTGASTADLAVILIDARKGLLRQTRRHSYLISLIGVRHVVVAVNKMDLVDYSRDAFDVISREYRALAERIGVREVTLIPVSAVCGDNIVRKSARTTWYGGPTLLECLDEASIDETYLQTQPLRMPVQWVNRPHAEFRGFAGTVSSGVLARGQRIRVLPSGRESTVTRIVTADGDLAQAVAHQSVTLTLADEIDVSRGDLIVLPESPAQCAEQFEATLVWMHEQPMLRGRSYTLKIGAATVAATVLPLKYKIDIGTFGHLASETLALNEIGVVELQLDRAIAFDSYERNRDTGLHPDRPHHQRHGRSRHVARGSATDEQHLLASARGGQACALPAQRAPQCGHLVDWIVGRGQIDDCQPPRNAFKRDGQANLPARRR